MRLTGGLLSLGILNGGTRGAASLGRLMIRSGVTQKYTPPSPHANEKTSSTIPKAVFCKPNTWSAIENTNSQVLHRKGPTLREGTA